MPGLESLSISVVMFRYGGFLVARLATTSNEVTLTGRFGLADVAALTWTKDTARLPSYRTKSAISPGSLWL